MRHANLLEEEWEFLTDLLPPDWREQARSTGALQRARGIPSADCLLQLILMHTATGLSLRQTVVRAREQSIADISDVALLKRLRSSEKWLQQLTADSDEIGHRFRFYPDSSPADVGQRSGDCRTVLGAKRRCEFAKYSMAIRQSRLPSRLG